MGVEASIQKGNTEYTFGDRVVVAPSVTPRPPSPSSPPSSPLPLFFPSWDSSSSKGNSARSNFEPTSICRPRIGGGVGLGCDVRVGGTLKVLMKINTTNIVQNIKADTQI